MNFVTESLDYYFKKKLNREIERSGKISSKSIYNFLSIYIEFLSIKHGLESDLEITKRYINKLTDLLEKTTIDYGNLEIKIHEQLYWFFTHTYWFYYESELLRHYYPEFLSSNNKNVKVRTWQGIHDLLSLKILKAEDIMTFKGHFINLLNNDDEKIREQAWNGWHLSELIRNNIVTIKESDR